VSLISHKEGVKMTEDERVRDVDRDYGMMKTHQSGTPFPRRTLPVDSVALTAKLEAEKKLNRVSIGSANEKRATPMPVRYGSEHDHHSERHKDFAQRRKLFDEGEFTICKGRKLGDDFHPLDLEEHNLRFEALFNKLSERKSYDTRNFDELVQYCLANNLKISS
ncbi:hypothetical protein KR059_012768, partial [Drosophila kikkawai]